MLRHYRFILYLRPFLFIGMGKKMESCLVQLNKIESEREWGRKSLFLFNFSTIDKKKHQLLSLLSEILRIVYLS